MTIIAEAAIVALFIFLGLFGKRSDVHLQCFQVNPETKVESEIGFLTIHRKHRSLSASFLNWGPHRKSFTTHIVLASGKKNTIAIYDTPEEISGHAYLLTEKHEITLSHKVFMLSENVIDPTRLDYCRRMHKKEWKQLEAELNP